MKDSKTKSQYYQSSYDKMKEEALVFLEIIKMNKVISEKSRKKKLYYSV